MLDPRARRWVVAFDAEGNDLALEAELAAMSPQERARTQANFRAFIDKVRPTLRPRARSEACPSPRAPSTREDPT